MRISPSYYCLANHSSDTRMDIMRPARMSLVDISKIFAMFQTRNEDDNGEIKQLSQTVSKDNVQLLEELLSQERYVQFINSLSGWGVPGTPLRLAAAKGHLRCLEVLLRYGAEVDSLDVKAQTPLFTAVSSRHPSCVRALLRAGANPNGSIHNNCSPVLTAAREGEVEMLRELLEHGAEVNVRSKALRWSSNTSAGSSPLYFASVYKHYDCFRLLLLYGADPDFNCREKRLVTRMKRRKTALDVCLRYGCGPEYIQLLIDFGANIYLPVLSADKNIQRKKAVQHLIRARAQPRCLISLARIVIRRCLKLTSGLRSIEQLDVPPILKNYLKHQT